MCKKEGMITFIVGIILAFSFASCDPDDAVTVVIDNQLSKELSYSIQWGNEDSKWSKVGAGSKATSTHWGSITTHSILFGDYLINVNGNNWSTYPSYNNVSAKKGDTIRYTVKPYNW